MPTDKQVEAAARAILLQDGCGRMFQGERVLCDDPRLEQHEKTCICREQASAALAAAEAAEPVQGWQPIETLSKEDIEDNHSDILLGNSCNGPEFFRWIDLHSAYGFPDDIAQVIKGEGVWTHWQPLPSPPTTEGE